MRIDGFEIGKVYAYTSSDTYELILIRRNGLNTRDRLRFKDGMVEYFTGAAGQSYTAHQWPEVEDEYFKILDLL